MKEKTGIHNARILNATVDDKLKCNCQKKKWVLIPWQCNQKNIIYQAEVIGDNKVMKYYGSTEDFKDRYYQHKTSFNDPDKLVNKSKGACIFKWRKGMWPLPYGKTCNYDGRTKYYVKQERRVTWILQASKKASPYFSKEFAHWHWMRPLYREY